MSSARSAWCRFGSGGRSLLLALFGGGGGAEAASLLLPAPLDVAALAKAIPSPCDKLRLYGGKRRGVQHGSLKWVEALVQRGITALTSCQRRLASIRSVQRPSGRGNS